MAVVLAGGTGTRVGLSIPKQLIKIAGKPIIEHTIGTLQASPQIDEIIVLMTPGHLDAVHAILRPGGYPKVTRVLEGADTRNATTQRALDALGDGGVQRPLPRRRAPAAEPAGHRRLRRRPRASSRRSTPPSPRPTRSSRSTRAGRTIDDVLKRGLLRRGQTPQGFRLSVIRRAYAEAAEDAQFEATDDCTVVLRYAPEVPIAVVRGEERNMKITEPIDVYIADKLFQLDSHEAPRPRYESEYRAALAGKTVVVFGGSYGIGADIARMAESYGAITKIFSRSATNTHVERRADIVAACEQVLAATGRIDYVVNTAGVLPRGELAETSEETVYSATEVNYLAPIHIAQVFQPHLKKTGGSLLLFTSSSYTRGRSGYSLYSSAKAAVVNLTQALADEWAGRRGPRQLRQPGAHGHPHAREGLRRGGIRLAPRLRGRGRHLHRRAGLRVDGAHRRRPPRGRAGHPHGRRRRRRDDRPVRADRRGPRGRRPARRGRWLSRVPRLGRSSESSS